MADKPTDSTRELVAGAEEMLDKRKSGAGADQLVGKAEALLETKQPEPTKDLIASSEKLLEKKRDSSGASWLLWVVLAAIAGAAAVFLLT